MALMASQQPALLAAEAQVSVDSRVHIFRVPCSHARANPSLLAELVSQQTPRSTAKIATEPCHWEYSLPHAARSLFPPPPSTHFAPAVRARNRSCACKLRLNKFPGPAASFQLHSRSRPDSHRHCPPRSARTRQWRSGTRPGWLQILRSRPHRIHCAGRPPAVLCF